MTECRLIDETIFASCAATEPGAVVRLAGAECAACATTVFPYQGSRGSCPACGGTDMTAVALPTDGTLWGFTVQGFEPKPPFRCDGQFQPYGVGYVDLGAVIVEGRLTENDPQQLRTGMPLRSILVPAFTDDGTAVLTYAFAPVPEQAEVTA